MIRPLRTLHRRVFVALAVALPALIVAAVRGRHAPPVQDLADEWLPVTPNPYWAGEDWLVYRVSEPAPRSGPLPADAELVGNVRSSAYELPLPPGKTLVTYSLIEGRIVRDPSDPEGRE